MSADNDTVEGKKAKTSDALRRVANVLRDLNIIPQSETPREMPPIQGNNETQERSAKGWDYYWHGLTLQQIEEFKNQRKLPREQWTKNMKIKLPKFMTSATTIAKDVRHATASIVTSGGQIKYVATLCGEGKEFGYVPLHITEVNKMKRRKWTDVLPHATKDHKPQRSIHARTRDCKNFLDAIERTLTYLEFIYVYKRIVPTSFEIGQLLTDACGSYHFFTQAPIVDRTEDCEGNDDGGWNFVWTNDAESYTDGSAKEHRPKKKPSMKFREANPNKKDKKCHLCGLNSASHDNFQVWEKSSQRMFVPWFKKLTPSRQTEFGSILEAMMTERNSPTHSDALAKPMISAIFNLSCEVMKCGVDWDNNEMFRSFPVTVAAGGNDQYNPNGTVFTTLPLFCHNPSRIAANHGPTKRFGAGRGPKRETSATSQEYTEANHYLQPLHEYNVIISAKKKVVDSPLCNSHLVDCLIIFGPRGFVIFGGEAQSSGSTVDDEFDKLLILALKMLSILKVFYGVITTQDEIYILSFSYAMAVNTNYNELVISYAVYDRKTEPFGSMMKDIVNVLATLLFESVVDSLEELQRTDSLQRDEDTLRRFAADLRLEETKIHIGSKHLSGEYVYYYSRPYSPALVGSETSARLVIGADYDMIARNMIVQNPLCFQYLMHGSARRLDYSGQFDADEALVRAARLVLATAELEEGYATIGEEEEEVVGFPFDERRDWEKYKEWKRYEDPVEKLRREQLDDDEQLCDYFSGIRLLPSASGSTRVTRRTVFPPKSPDVKRRSPKRPSFDRKGLPREEKKKRKKETDKSAGKDISGSEVRRGYSGYSGWRQRWKIDQVDDSSDDSSDDSDSNETDMFDYEKLRAVRRRVREPDVEQVVEQVDETPAPSTSNERERLLVKAIDDIRPRLDKRVANILKARKKIADTLYLHDLLGRDNPDAYYNGDTDSPIEWLTIDLTRRIPAETLAIIVTPKPSVPRIIRRQYSESDSEDEGSSNEQYYPELEEDIQTAAEYEAEFEQRQAIKMYKFDLPWAPEVRKKQTAFRKAVVDALTKSHAAINKRIASEKKQSPRPSSTDISERMEQETPTTSSKFNISSCIGSTTSESDIVSQRQLLLVESH